MESVINKKAEYNKRAYMKRKDKLSTALPSTEIKETINENNNSKENNKYYQKYKNVKKERNQYKEDCFNAQLEIKYLKQLLQQTQQSQQPQQFQPVVQLIQPNKQVKNKTKIENYENVITINDFFNNIKIDHNDIRDLRNIRGDTANDKQVNFIYDLIKRRYDLLNEDEKPFYCSDRRRKVLLYKQNDFEIKKILKETLTREEMIKNGFNVHQYKECLNDIGQYDFYINERCYNQTTRWITFKENDNSDNLLFFLSKLIKQVINNYNTALNDILVMSFNENDNEVEVSPLKILTTSIRENFNKILKLLCDMSYVNDIE
jgi:hypothetical protein